MQRALQSPEALHAVSALSYVKVTQYQLIEQSVERMYSECKSIKASYAFLWLVIDSFINGYFNINISLGEGQRDGDNGENEAGK